MKLICRFACLAAVLAFFAGCGSSNPLDKKISSATPHDYVVWRQRAGDDLTPDQAKALDDAVNELKLKAQVQGKKGDDTDAAALKEIDGKTVSEAIQAGFAWKLARLNEQKVFYETALAKNAELKTRPGDTASADFLADRRASQERQRDEANRQIDEAQTQLKALGIAVPKPAVAPAPIPTDDTEGNATTGNATAGNATVGNATTTGSADTTGNATSTATSTATASTQ